MAKKTKQAFKDYMPERFIGFINNGHYLCIGGGRYCGK